MLVCQRIYKMLNLKQNRQHLVIPVDILSLVYCRLFSCMVFPNKLMEKMRRSRNSAIS